MNKVNSSSMLRTKDMTKIGMLSVIGFILMYFQLPLTFVAPPFMKLDISDLPVLLGAFTMGPAYGLSLIHISDPRDGLLSRMPSSA